MTFKDHALKDIVAALKTQSEQLAKANNSYLRAEAEKRHFESLLISKAPGKSIAERKVSAEAQTQYLEFHQALASLEAVKRFHELKMSVLEKEYFAQLAEMKLDNASIKRGVE